MRRGDTDLLPDEISFSNSAIASACCAAAATFRSCAGFTATPSKAPRTSATSRSASARRWDCWLEWFRFPIPGVGRITLGLAGVLLVALVLGTVRRTAGIVWVLPLSASLVLRNFGLTVFLAQVGISSGPQFAATVADTGLTFILLGALIVLPLVLITMIAGRLMAIPVDDLFGIVAGVTGNPGILAYASRAVPTDRPDIGYAMIFPSMSLVKILFVQIAGALLSRP